MAFEPKEVGNQLIIVGQKQVATGKNLDRSAKQVRQVGEILNQDGRVARSMESIESGTRSIPSLLAPVRNTLRSVANALSAISIPTVTPQTQTINFPVVGSIRFVTSISVTSARPFNSIASNISSMADDIDNVRSALLTTAEAIKDLRGVLPDIQRNVFNGANEMEQGGNALVEAGATMEDAGKLFGGTDRVLFLEPAFRR